MACILYMYDQTSEKIVSSSLGGRDRCVENNDTGSSRGRPVTLRVAGRSCSSMVRVGSSCPKGCEGWVASRPSVGGANLAFIWHMTGQAALRLGPSLLLPRMGFARARGKIVHSQHNLIDPLSKICTFQHRK